MHELGRGAMGITYKAIDTNLQVPVALKVINPDLLQTDAARARFVREARSAARLRHPHVASVFHLGTESDTWFYAMEYIAGETVESLIKRRGPLPPIIALRLAAQVARALIAAETHGLVHRDIKPANLMLVSADEELCIKVIDFGVAKEAADREQSIGLIGTPHFASPEQLENRPTDIRSDIYSLGATLWFMLTGEPPFHGSLAEIIHGHLHSPLPPEGLAGLSPPIYALVRRLLTKDPAERPQTASELRRELETCLAEYSAEDEARAGQEERLIAEETSHVSSVDTLAAPADPEAMAGRFQVLRRVGETNEGLIYHARDPRTGREVRLLVLRPNFLADARAFTQLEQTTRRLAGLSHPNLLGVVGLENIDSAAVVVMEWCEGISLREVLRIRRELTGAESLQVLEQLAAGVDYAAAHEVPQLDLSLHAILITFPSADSPPEEIVRSAPAQWPSFQLKLNPLSLKRAASFSETWAGGQTMLGQPGQTARASETGTSAARGLPALTYELLGGALKTIGGGAGSGATRYTPLASLTEEGNEVLRQALDPDCAPASGAEFLARLRAVDQLTTRQRLAPAADSGRSPELSPAPRRSLFIPVLATAVLVLAGGTWYFTHSRESTPPSPQPEKLPQAVIEPAATPAPAPPAPPDRRDVLKAAVAEAEETEEAGDLAASLHAWLAVAENWPESEVGRMRMELLLDKVRVRQPKLSGAELDQALPALREAAGHEVVSAMLLLADSLLATDAAESFHWYSAAGAKGVPSALTEMGLLYSNGRGVARDLAAAVECFDKAAEKGDAAAKAALAECYLTAKGVTKDEARAIGLLREASAQGNARAMNRLATCYHQGTGVSKNFAEAFRLYSAAADAGLSEAIGNLGVLYMNGEGVPPSPSKAVELFRKGAGEGDGYCMFLYARCQESGTGVAASVSEAQAWYRRSAAAGFPRAAEWCRAHGVPVP